MFSLPKISLIVLAFSTILFSDQSKADIVINVDISDLSSVTFITTEAFAAGSFEGLGLNGITLRDFFTGNTSVVSGGLVDGEISVFDSADGSQERVLDRIWINTFNGGYTRNDVSFYTPEPSIPIFSFDDRRALTGSAAFDLTAFNGLPEIGETGNVFFDAPDRNQIIGQWRIVSVPEPASGMILMFSSLLLLRRRRQQCISTRSDYAS